MKRIVFATGALLAATLFTVSPLQAADLDDGYDRYSYKDSPYDDPRYGDVYRHPKVAEEPYREVEPYRTYDDERTYVPRRYSRVERPYAYDRRGCLDKLVIRRKLRHDGWGDFDLVRAENDFAILKARQANGDLYRLRVDRCTGDVLNARLLDSPYRGSYATRRGPYYRTY